MLHYYFEKLTLLGFPTNEFTLRFPSVIFDLSALLVLYSITNSFFGPKTALITAALYTFLEFPIYFAQEGRMYSLLALECLLVLRLILPLSEFTLKKAALLFLVTACGLYTHYYFTFFTMGVGLSLLFDYKNPNFKKALIAFIFGGIAFLPWLNIVIKLAASGGQTFREFSLISVPYSIFRFVAGYSVFPLDSIVKADQSHAMKQSLPILIFYSAISSILVLLGLLALRKTKSTRYILFPLITSSVIPLLISIKTPMFSERYLSGILPLICILFALGLQSLSGIKRKLLVTFLSAAILCSLYSHYGGNPRFKKEEWKELVAYLRANQLTASVVVQPDFIKPILTFYCPECVVSNPPELTPEIVTPEATLVTRGAKETKDLSLQTLAVFPAESGLYVKKLL